MAAHDIPTIWKEAACRASLLTKDLTLSIGNERADCDPSIVCVCFSGQRVEFSEGYQAAVPPTVSPLSFKVG